MGDLGSVPGLEISSGGGHSNPLQCSCLENPMDRGACWATVQGVAKSRTWLSNQAHSTQWYIIGTQSSYLCVKKVCPLISVDTHTHHYTKIVKIYHPPKSFLVSQCNHVSCVCVFSSVQSLSDVWLFATPGTAARQASLSITNSRSILKPMSSESGMPSNHLILCRPLLPLSIFPSTRVFSNESALCIRFPQYWSFSINPSNEYSRLISFRMDWLDLPAVQGTLESLLQHHSSKASILWHSALFIVQLSHPYVTTRKS